MNGENSRYRRLRKTSFATTMVVGKHVSGLTGYNGFLGMGSIGHDLFRGKPVKVIQSTAIAFQVYIDPNSDPNMTIGDTFEVVLDGLYKGILTASGTFIMGSSGDEIQTYLNSKLEGDEVDVTITQINI